MDSEIFQSSTHHSLPSFFGGGDRLGGQLE